MRRRATLLVAAAFCTFAAGTSVVTASAAPTGRAAVRTATGTTSSGWNTRPSTAAPHKVDVATLPRAGAAGNPNINRLPLLVADPAAYAAAKKNPKATPGLAITQPASAPSSGVLSPQAATFLVNFAGINLAQDIAAGAGAEPPDTQIAVGPTRILEMVNSTGRIFDRTGAAVTSPFLLSDFFVVSFWSNNFFGGEPMTPADPRVLYDASTGRWYATVVVYDPVANTPGYFDSITLLGISQTTDPAGSWIIYGMDAEGGPGQVFGPPALCDQPKLGYSADKFVIGCSLFNTNGSFRGAIIMVGNKSEGLAGANMAEDETFPNTSLFGLVPAQSFQTGLADAYVAFNEDKLGTAATGVVGIFGLPHSTTFTQHDIAMTATSAPPLAPQLGSPTAIDTGDDRFMSAILQAGTLYTSGGESCTPAGDSTVRACLRLVEVNLSAMTLIQGTTAGLVGNYLINPTLGVNSYGDVVFEYSTSSATTYPDVETAIQPVGDMNALVGGGQLVAGTGPYVSTVQNGFSGLRWGDYGAVGVDPGNTAYIWVAGEFSNGPADGLNGTQWGTQIAVLNGHIAQLCTATGLTTSLPSPEPPGTSITLTASASCVTGATPEYQFWIKPPSGDWAMVQDYGQANTFNWTGQVTLGTYTLEVLVRATIETLKAYDSFFSIPYMISAAACSTPTLTTDLPSPQIGGTSVVLTASSTCPDTIPLYAFYVRTPDLVWHLIQAYSSTNTATWNAFDTQIGSYVLEVLVKNTGSLNSYDTLTAMPYSMLLCTATTLTTSATSPYASGAGAITLTATGTCAGTTEYQFYYKDSAGVFHLIQAYSATSTATWNADYKAGTYQLLAEIRPVGSTAGYVTYVYVPFTLTGCGVPTLASDKSSPQVAGATVSWTATVTCSGTPQYAFYVESPAGIWTLAQPYSASNTFAWNSPTTPGAYMVEVLVRNSGAAEDLWDNFLSAPFTLGLCNTPTLTPSASSPYASGAGAITLTATGTCAGSTEYQFYFQDPSLVWHLIQAYSAGTTASWNADYKAGAYTLLVEIRPVGSSATYITFTKLPFTLTGCGVPTLASDKPSPQVAGTTVTFTATVTCSGTPQYQFYVRTPAGVWTLAQDWSASNTFAWTPTTTGSYLVEVLVRNTGAVEDIWDNYLSVAYLIE